MLRLKVVVMNRREKPRGKSLFDEDFIDDDLRLIVDQRSRFPIVNLMLQRLKIPLHLMEPNRSLLLNHPQNVEMVWIGGDLLYSSRLALEKLRPVRADYRLRVQ